MKATLLRNVSLGYLLLPNLIFSVGWFRLPLSILLVTGLVIVFVYNFERKPDTGITLETKDLTKILAIALLLSAFSGIGGYCFQAFDYWAHNSKYYTVYNHSWPVLFKGNGRYACHYFGFYLVPALISKGLGHLSGGVLFVWASVGIFLGICWIFIFTKKCYLSLIFFLSLGGIGHVTKVLFLQATGLNYHVPPFFTETWPVLYQSQWAPNQLIPVILVSCILFYDFVYTQAPERSFLAVTSIFIWGIFPSIVCVMIFGAFVLLRYHNRLKELFTVKFLIHLIVPGMLLIPTLFYFLAGRNSVVSGFIWQFKPLNEIAFHYFFGVIVDLTALCILIVVLKLHKSSHNLAIYVLLALLICISIIRMGKWNDWFLRGSMPVMTLLSLFILHRFSAWIRGQPLWYRQKVAFPIVFFLILGLVVPSSHIFRALRQNVFTHAMFPNEVQFTPYPYDQFEDFYQMGKSIYSEQEANQFLGQKGSLYEMYFAR